MNTSRTGFIVMKNLHLGVATMQQAGTVIREFYQELEQCTRDVDMTKEDMKVYLVSVLKQSFPKLPGHIHHHVW